MILITSLIMIKLLKGLSRIDLNILIYYFLMKLLWINEKAIWLFNIYPIFLVNMPNY